MVDVLKEECELVMYLKLLKHKLTQAEMSKLENLISEYGEEQYYQGVYTENINNNNSI